MADDAVRRDIDEVARTIDRVREALDTLALRGVRAAGPPEIAALQSHRDSLRRSGAPHLAASLEALLQGIRDSRRDAARTLLRARASVRLFERLLTLRSVRMSLRAALATKEEG